MILILACTAEPPTPEVALGNARTVAPEPLVAGDFRDFGRDPNTPRGPLAVLPDPEGFAVLDQELGRLARFTLDGQPLEAVPRPQLTTFDARHDGEGWALLALHPGADPHWSAQRIDDGGGVLEDERIPVEAPSAVFPLDGRLLAEQAHGELVDVVDGTRFPGRPGPDGRFVAATKVGHDVELSWTDEDGLDARQVLLRSDRRLATVMSLEQGEAGTLVGLLLYEEGPAPDYEMRAPEIRAVLLDERGHLLDELRLPVTAELDQQRNLALVGDELLQLETSPRGVSVARRSLR